MCTSVHGERVRMPIFATLPHFKPSKSKITTYQLYYEQITEKHAKGSSLIIAAWNVRTLLDNEKSDRPKRRTALVAEVDIAKLSETRLAGEGHIIESHSGYTFY
jgi:predicted amidohydrolase